jgi:hypothetical protein
MIIFEAFFDRFRCETVGTVAKIGLSLKSNQTKVDEESNYHDNLVLKIL